MTKVEMFHAELAGWQGFKVLGHSGFAAHGEDIVCAAVSVLTQTTILGLQRVVDVDCLVQIDEDLGLLICFLPEKISQEKWDQAQLILDVLYVGLTATEAEYGDYLTVKEVPYHENESTIIRHKKGWW